MIAELIKARDTLKHEVPRVPIVLEPLQILLHKHCTYDVDWNLPLCPSLILCEFYINDIKLYIKQSSTLTLAIISNY